MATSDIVLWPPVTLYYGHQWHCVMATSDIVLWPPVKLCYGHQWHCIMATIWHYTMSDGEEVDSELLTREKSWSWSYDNVFCHISDENPGFWFASLSPYGTSGSVWYRQRAVRCLLMFVSFIKRCFYLHIYAKLGLVLGMTKQMLNDKEADIVHC